MKGNPAVPGGPLTSIPAWRKPQGVPPCRFFFGRRARTAAEQQLVKSLPAEKGRDLLKQVRTHLVETARPLLEAVAEEATGVRPVSLHHDISTVTGEEVILFTLAEAPALRETRKR